MPQHRFSTHNPDHYTFLRRAPHSWGKGFILHEEKTLRRSRELFSWLRWFFQRLVP